MEELKKLYKEATGLDVANVEAIPGAGSNRKYYRMKGNDGSTLIGAVGTSRDENHAFCYLAKHFTAAGLPVPQVIAEGEDGLRYLQSDLGDQSLFDALKGGREAGGRYNAHERELLRRTIAALPAMQIRGALGLDFTQCYPQEALDETNVLFDLNYFKYCFLKATGLDFHELKLEASFQLMARDIETLSGTRPPSVSPEGERVISALENITWPIIFPSSSITKSSSGMKSGLVLYWLST